MRYGDGALVSVVIPTRNRGDQLFEAIDSALAQTWPAIEVIVVDDGSTDQTVARLRERASAEPRLRVVRNETSQGGSTARNQGVAASRGPLIAFLDDDDLWHPDKVRLQVERLDASPGAAAVSCGFVVRFPSGRDCPVVVKPSAGPQQLLQVNHLGGASMCLTPRDTFEAVGGFDPGLPSCQDWDLWIKLSRAGSIVVSDGPLVIYRPHVGVRITTQVRAAYLGRRRVFLRYRAAMADATRRHHLAELIFLRSVRLGTQLPRRCAGFMAAGRLAGMVGALRFAYRLVKA